MDICAFAPVSKGFGPMGAHARVKALLWARRLGLRMANYRAARTSGGPVQKGPRMEVILHIGAHRTGTTTLQRFLQANHARLADQLIASWGPDRTRRGLFSGLIKAPHRITPDVTARATRATGLIRVEIERLSAQGFEHLIVSEENIIGSMENNLFTRHLYPHARFRVGRFVPAFGDTCRRIVLGIRSYDRHWASSLGYLVKAGYGLPARDHVAQLALQPVRWRQIIRQVAEVFPDAELVVWPFEAMVAVPEQQLAVLSGRNVPGPFQGARDWHNTGPGRDHLRALLAEMGDMKGRDRIPPGAGAWQPFTQTETAHLRALYAEDIAWLRAGADGLATYFEGPPDRTGAIGPRRGLKDDERHRGLG